MNRSEQHKKKNTNPDFEAFKSDVSWFVSPKSNIELHDRQGIRLSAACRNTFPVLSELIDLSRQTYLTIDDVEYVLFAWDSQDGQVCGWLNKQESPDAYTYEFIEEHELLLRNIGGIQESFNAPEQALSNNQNFLFIGSECTKGIGDWDDYYTMLCTEDGKKEIDHAHLLAFVHEANGALTLYDPKTKKVLLFSHDHSFDNVDFLENQPAYTFHRIHNADTFTDYVEKLARQWKQIIQV